MILPVCLIWLGCGIFAYVLLKIVRYIIRINGKLGNFGLEPEFWLRTSMDIWGHIVFCCRMLDVWTCCFGCEYASYLDDVALSLW